MLPVGTVLKEYQNLYHPANDENVSLTATNLSDTRCGDGARIMADTDPEPSNGDFETQASTMNHSQEADQAAADLSAHQNAAKIGLRMDLLAFEVNVEI